MSDMFIQILNQAVFMVICRLGPGYGIYKLTDLGMDVIEALQEYRTSSAQCRCKRLSLPGHYCYYFHQMVAMTKEISHSQLL